MITLVFRDYSFTQGSLNVAISGGLVCELTRLMGSSVKGRYRKQGSQEHLNCFGSLRSKAPNNFVTQSWTRFSKSVLGRRKPGGRRTSNNYNRDFTQKHPDTNRKFRLSRGKSIVTWKTLNFPSQNGSGAIGTAQENTSFGHAEAGLGFVKFEWARGSRSAPMRTGCTGNMDVIIDNVSTRAWTP